MVGTGYILNRVKRRIVQGIGPIGGDDELVTEVSATARDNDRGWVDVVIYVNRRFTEEGAAALRKLREALDRELDAEGLRVTIRLGKTAREFRFVR